MLFFDIFFRYHRELLSGLAVTISLCFFIFPLGITVGAFLGIIRYKWIFWGQILGFVSIILSATPILVFLFWLHYPFQYMLKIVINPYYTTIIALSFVMSFLISDLVYNALINFPQSLLESAKVCGLSSTFIFLEIMLPIVYRQIVPNILSVMVIILQSTIFSSLISVNEVFRVAQQINSDIYKPVEIYSSLALFFAFICLIINYFAFLLRKKYKWSLAGL